MVKFTDYISSCIIAKYADKYICYEDLNNALEVRGKAKLVGVDEFYNMLEVSYSTCKTFIDAWIDRLNNFHDSPDILSEAMELNQFAFVNQEALRKIIKKHDKQNPHAKIYISWRWRMDFLVTDQVLNLMFNVIKLKPDKAANAALVHHDPTTLTKQEDSFVRESTKYWVKTCDVAAVCLMLGQNLEAFVFDKKAANPKSPLCDVTSVYFDNENKDSFRERLAKSQGARCLRLRTYGNNQDSVSHNTKVWVERKVHHEKWSGQTSSKDRFCITGRDVMPLIRGMPMTVQQKNKMLCDEVQALIQERKMLPALRVEYDRIAFQGRDHDHVRVSLDLNMRLYRERTTHLDWYTEKRDLGLNDLIAFDHAILEIKLREPFIDTPPQFIRELCESTLVHKQNNFSKFTHATYAFAVQDGVVESMKLTKPLWWDEMQFISPQMPIEARENTAIVGIDTGANKGLQDDDRHWFAKMFMLGDQPVDENGKVLRVEPKVFFANERTFLSWFQTALLTCSIGVAVAAAGHFAVGGILILIGFIVAVYANLTYLQRTTSLVNRVASGYHDHFGPLMLSCVVISAFLTAFALSA